MTISAALITFNEEGNIVDCLESVKWADEIIIVDSGSKDQTVSLGKRYTPHIYVHPFKNFAEQKNFALSKTKGDWVFFIDSDERVTPELAAEIKNTVAASQTDAVYRVPRTTYFFHHRLRFSGTQNDAPIRLFPRTKVFFEQPVHEHIKTELPVKTLQAPLTHYSTRDLAHYKIKLKQYVDLELETMRLKERKVYFWDPILRPLGKFFILYILQLGILDGLPGLQLAILSSYYDFLKYTKYLRREKDHGQ